MALRLHGFCPILNFNNFFWQIMVLVWVKSPVKVTNGIRITVRVRRFASREMGAGFHGICSMWWDVRRAMTGCVQWIRVYRLIWWENLCWLLRSFTDLQAIIALHCAMPFSKLVSAITRVKWVKQGLLIHLFRALRTVLSSSFLRQCLAISWQFRTFFDRLRPCVWLSLCSYLVQKPVDSSLKTSWIPLVLIFPYRLVVCLQRIRQTHYLAWEYGP